METFSFDQIKVYNREDITQKVLMCVIKIDSIQSVKLVWLVIMFISEWVLYVELVE